MNRKILALANDTKACEYNDMLASTTAAYDVPVSISVCEQQQRTYAVLTLLVLRGGLVLH